MIKMSVGPALQAAQWCNACEIPLNSCNGNKTRVTHIWVT